MKAHIKPRPLRASPSDSGGSTDSGCGRECRRCSRPTAGKATASAAVAAVVVPPDGGWGWAVLAAAFLCNVTTDGVLFSFGAMLPHLARDFGVAESRAAVVGSLMQGVFLMAGPAAAAAVGARGLRPVAIAGGLLSAAGYLLSYFVYSLPLMYLTHGVLIGIGFGCTYMTSLISVGFYFEKWRALATGIVTCGSGVGVVIFGPLETYLIEALGWRQVLLCQAALTSLCVLYGACFRPLKPTMPSPSPLPSDNDDCDSESEPLKLDLAKSDASAPHDAVTSATVTVPLAKAASLGGGGACGLGDSWESGLDSNYSSMSSVSKSQYAGAHTRRMTAPDLLPPLPRPREHPGVFYSREDLLDAKRRALRRQHPLRPQAEATEEEAQPLARKDVLYSGNLMKLPEYASRASGLQAGLAGLAALGGGPEEVCYCHDPATRRSTLSAYVRILRSPSFLLYSAHGLFVMLGFLTPYLFSASRARQAGMSAPLAVWLVSSIGIANTCGKVAFGSLVSLTGVDAALTCAAALAVGAAALAGSGLSTAVWYQFACNLLYGLVIGCFSSMKTVVLAELLGLEQLTNAFGLFLVFLGMGSLLGPPFLASLRETFQDPDMPFYIVGGFLAISSLLMFSLRYVNRWEREKTVKAAAARGSRRHADHRV